MCNERWRRVIRLRPAPSTPRFSAPPRRSMDHGPRSTYVRSDFCSPSHHEHSGYTTNNLLSLRRSAILECGYALTLKHVRYTRTRLIATRLPSLLLPSQFAKHNAVSTLIMHPCSEATPPSAMLVQCKILDHVPYKRLKKYTYANFFISSTSAALATFSSLKSTHDGLCSFGSCLRTKAT